MLRCRIHNPLIDLYLSYQKKPVTWVVGFSGGLDSTVLLHLAAAVREQYPDLTLIAAHVHHGLSANADHWLRHCVTQAEQLQLPFVSARVGVDKDGGNSLEANARNARYRALAEMAPQDADLLVGHHLDDQVETLLLQLKRGSGPLGLGAMTATSPWRDHDCIHRPLLDLSRQHLEDYARDWALDWIEDESNQDLTFDRNFVRHALLPMFNQRWPGASKAMARSAMLCKEQALMLAEATGDKLQAMCTEDGAINLQALASMSPPWRRALWREWIDSRGGSAPSMAVLQQIDQQLLNSPEDAQPCVSWGGVQVRRFRDKGYLLLMTEDSWEGEFPLVDGIPQGLPPGAPQLQLREQGQGDSHQPLVFLAADARVIQTFGRLTMPFKPRGENHHKPLKQWMKLWGIPPWQRQRVPLLMCDEVIVAVGTQSLADLVSIPGANKQTYALVQC